jgi:hypothetical protein
LGSQSDLERAARDLRDAALLIGCELAELLGLVGADVDPEDLALPFRYCW